MKIKLVDGFEFEAELNGNNIIPAVEVADDELQEDNLVEVYIDDIKHENMICDNNFKIDGKQHLIIRPLTERELKDKDIEAKLEYIAMMGGVEL
jgi:hypothetical protein